MEFNAGLRGNTFWVERRLFQDSSETFSGRSLTGQKLSIEDYSTEFISTNF